jgi:hypothetical protein
MIGLHLEKLPAPLNMRPFKAKQARPKILVRLAS